MSRYKIRNHSKVEFIYDDVYMSKIEQQLIRKKLVLEPNAFYAFIDETGHEELSLTHKLFAFSGFCFNHLVDQESFEKEWRKLKTNLLKTPADKPFHAKDHLRKFKRKDNLLFPVINMLDSYNIKYIFSCVLDNVVMDKADYPKRTRIVSSMSENLTYCASSLLNSRADYDEWYFEHSKRLSPLMIISGFTPKYKNSAMNRSVFFLEKSLMCPFMEAADFISYVVGQSVLSSHLGLKSPFNNLFGETFGNSSKALLVVSNMIMGPFTMKSPC